jgi:hypothetical protein
MATVRTSIALILALLLGPACGSEPEKDPITTKCEAVCSLDPAHACASQQGDCILKCRSFGTQAQGFGGPACGDCVAGTSSYAVDSGGRCIGYVHKTELSPECYSYCVQPDAGATGI